MDRRIEQLAVASFFAVVIMLATFDVVNHDFGFHLKAGEYIWLNRAIPTQDVFSFLAEGNRWVDSHWLFQLVLYGVYSIAGIAGTVGLRIVVLCATFALIFRIGYRREYLSVSIAIGLLVIFTTCQRFVVRPELASFFFLAGFSYCLENFSKRPRLALVAIPLGQAIWANSHGLYPLGIGLVGAHLVGEASQHFASQRLSWIPHPKTSRPELRRKSLLLVVTCMAALVNGNGLDGILYPVTIFRELWAQVPWYPAISELRPPFELGGRFPSPIFFYNAFLAISLFALIANARNVRLAEVLPYLGFLCLSLLAVRNTAIFAIVAGPITVRNINGMLDRGFAHRKRPHVGRHQISALVALTSIAIAVGIGSTIVDGSLYRTLGWKRTFGIGESEQYPKEVVAHLGALEGRFFNSPQIGGYLIWKLYPQKQVAVDGRWEVYGEPLRRYMKAYRDPSTFFDLAAEHDISAVVLYSRRRLGSKMASWLLASGAWEITLTTRNATVLERK